MKKISPQFPEKTEEPATTQKKLAEKIGPVRKKEEKVLPGKSDHYTRTHEQIVKRNK